MNVVLGPAPHAIGSVAPCCELALIEAIAAAEG